MMRSFTLFSLASLLVSCVLAQKTIPALDHSVGVPPGVTADCKAYLTTLNTDKQVSAYTTSITNAAGNQTQGSIDTLCSGNSDASTFETYIQSQLGQFYDKCGDDLRSNNQEVIDLYDSVYLLIPFRNAICSQDTSTSGYCVQNIAKYASSTASSTDNSDRTDGNVAFLFLQPSMDSSVLCTDCTNKILSSYISFETSSPYAIGLSNSKLLSGQSALYNSVATVCPKDNNGSSAAHQINLLAGTTAFEIGGAVPLVPALSLLSTLLVASVVALL